MLRFFLAAPLDPYANKPATIPDCHGNERAHESFSERIRHTFPPPKKAEGSGTPHKSNNIHGYSKS